MFSFTYFILYRRSENIFYIYTDICVSPNPNQVSIIYYVWWHIFFCSSKTKKLLLTVMKWDLVWSECFVNKNSKVMYLVFKFIITKFVIITLYRLWSGDLFDMFWFAVTSNCKIIFLESISKASAVSLFLSSSALFWNFRKKTGTSAVLFCCSEENKYICKWKVWLIFSKFNS